MREVAMVASDTQQRAQDHLRDLAHQLEVHHGELTDRLFQEMSTKVTELPDDPLLLDLLRASVASNLENVVHFLRGHLVEDELSLPKAAEEYARRLAQRDTPPGALLRAYRLGQMAVLVWAREVTAELLSDRALALAATEVFTDATFLYIDAVSERVMGAYQDERDQWLTNRSTVKREAVTALLSGTTDLDAAEHALGHRLRQRHLGVLLWRPGGSLSTAGLSALERHLTTVGHVLKADGAPLFVPQDGAVGWGWLPLGHREPDDLPTRLAQLRQPDDVALAFGTPAEGPEGFRITHEEAQEAHRVALLDDRRAGISHYADPSVRAAALLAVDLPRTRRMVRRTLRGLAVDTDAAARLRETLLVFLQERDSYVSAAERLHLHKNTVRYRVERAVQLRGRTLDDDRLDLELALHACARLGTHVLSPAE